MTRQEFKQQKLALVLKAEMTRQELQKALRLKDEKHFRKIYLSPALKSGLIKMTIPEKPKSRYQKYRLSLKGQKYAKEKSS